MAGCVGRRLLERFLGGELSLAESESVVNHVEVCAACQSLLDQLAHLESVPPLDAWLDDPERWDAEPADDFLDRLRRALPEESPPPDVLLKWARARAGGEDEPPAASRAGRAAAHPAVPGYEILSELSRGGMGVVFRARQVGLNRVVALKMVLAGGCARAIDRARFHTEAEAVGRLHHPNIVQIYDIGESDGCPYFSMEMVGGPTLAMATEGRPQPARVAAALTETMARAIHYAHERGILHRDLKPANVLLEPLGIGNGRAGWGADKPNALAPDQLLTSFWAPKLADFGLAKRLDDLTSTRHGQIVGTPSYMAPEQVDAKGQALSAAVDVYSLGAILYELLTGRPPLVAGSIESALAILASDDPIPPRRLQPNVPRDLETICLKCLEKQPGRRYASAAELADDLARFLAGEPVLARPLSALDRWGKLARRHRAFVVGVPAVMAALALGIAAAGVMAVRETRARRLADQNSAPSGDRADESPK